MTDHLFLLQFETSHLILRNRKRMFITTDDGMKRGRPSLREKIRPVILDVLGSVRTPMTVNAIKEKASSVMDRNVSWNTVRKYLQELIEANKVEAIALPPSKEKVKKGLTVYVLKR